MKKLLIYVGLGIILTTVFMLTTASINAQEGEELIDLSEAWRLPFNDTLTISCAPDEHPPYTEGQCAHIRYTRPNGLVVKDEMAIDYTNATETAAATSFPVLAPADGVVLDVGNDNPGYGFWIRIQHNGKYSFFAHLSQRDVVAGDSVIQGEQIGLSGKSGLPPANGIHLHFDARTGTPSSSPYSGNPSPIRAIPGNWFNTWYSPFPDLHYNNNLASGGAKYPPVRKRPNTTSQGARHLSNQQSPQNFPAVYVTNISPNQATLHFGAAPDTPATDWNTNFITTEFYGGQWNAVPLGGPILPGPIYEESIGTANQSESNHQHTWAVYAQSVQMSQNTQNVRYVELWPGRTSDNTPHFTAVYRVGSVATSLEFCEGAERYQVYEFHGGTETLAYDGPDCSILVNRASGGQPNQYRIRGRFSGTWSPYSPVIYLHF